MKNEPDGTAEASPASSRPRLWNSIPIHLLALAGLTACYAAASWRRWPHPFVDFGDELYKSWRISQGALLYRDVGGLYGPFSDYVNAAIFALFGPGIMHLVWANLAVFGAILAALYCLLRRAWGPGAALVASATFVSVFGFSQFVPFSSYTYAAPYSHAATHGFLVLLLLLAVIGRWLEDPSGLWGFSAGLLFGLSAVLKHDILFAALALTAAAGALRRLRGGRVGVRGAALWAAGAALPTLLFFGFFARHLPFGEAWGAACYVWLKVSATAAMAGNPAQIRFFGFDRPWANLVRHIQATFVAVEIIAAVLLLGKAADREPNPLTGAAIGAATAAGVLAIAWWTLPWIDAGRCLLGLMLLYLAWHAAATVRGRGPDPAEDLRLLFAVLAAALMARMALNGRLYQYGFFQAALAGAVVPAVLLGESPGWVSAKRRGRLIITAGFLCLLLSGIAILTAQSRRIWGLKTYAVGQGADLFYAFSPDRDPAGQIVRHVAEFLSRQSGDRTLLVLPEGVMLNYLARLPSPSAPLFYFTTNTEEGREAGIVDELRRRPPDLVVIMSRDLREYKIQRYGESVGKGQLLVRWVSANYAVIDKIGGDPLDFRQPGAVVLRRNSAQAASKRREAPRIKRGLVETHNDLGNALARQGRAKEAIEHYREALRLKPDAAEVHNNWGVVLAGQGRAEEAIGHYREAVRLNPDYAAAHNNLGLALAGQGKVEEALRHLRTALSISPDYAEARKNLSAVLDLQRTGRSR
jgi:tetratricopeptide (TPR) repeat protein